MEFNFKEYVFHKRRQGCSDKQIATSLGMSLKHFLSKIEEIENKNPIIKTFNEQMAETFVKPNKKKEKEPEPEIVELVATEEVKEPVEES